jgi:Reverse transcriptase (RNA-dependent DNA polymerase)
MGFSQRFTSLNNFELAFDRIVRGQNKDYKAFFRHLYPSYRVSLKDNLQDLISDIKRGRYNPSPPAVVYLPKKNGVLRPLRLLSLHDQMVYQAIANVVAIAFKAEQDKYALRRCYGALVNGKSDQFFFQGWKKCYRAFDQTIVRNFKTGKDFVADFDLVSFYELIDHKLLDDVLKKRVKDFDLLALLCDCLEKWTENHRGVKLHHGIPQGPEPSAFLAECVLFSFDAIKFKDVTYLRYIDDIKLMGKHESQLRRALLKLDLASKELGLVPQAQKIECRRVFSVDELRKNVPSRIASITPTARITKTTQRRLERLFRRSLKKEKGQWNIVDVTKFKFALFRMKPKLAIAKRIAPLLDQRPDLSWVLAAYFSKFSQNKRAADTLLVALQRDPHL